MRPARPSAYFRKTRSSPAGAERLLGWLDEHDAFDAVVRIQNAACRLWSPAVRSACRGQLQGPQRSGLGTHRDRHEQGRGKSDPGDEVAIAQVVLRKRAQLGPALERELIRALALLEGLRRQPVYQRTQAIQRLRAVWTQVDLEGEARVIHCQRQRELRRLKRISFGAGIADQAAARCIWKLAREIERLNERIATLEHKLEELLGECGNPFADLAGAGATVAVALIAQSGDVRRFKDKAAYARFCGVAPLRCGSGGIADHHRLDRGGNRN